MKVKSWEVICEDGIHYVEFTLNYPDTHKTTLRALPTLIIDGIIREGLFSADRKKLRVAISDSEVGHIKNVTTPELFMHSAQKGRGSAQKPSGSKVTDSSPKVSVPDPLADGKFNVVRYDYDYGDESLLLPGYDQRVEFRAAVYLPDSGEACPVVVFLHGASTECTGGPIDGWPCADGFEPVPNYSGYSPIAEELARHGYAVVSVSANGVVGFVAVDKGNEAFAHLLVAHLDLLNEANTGNRPELSYMEGRLDLQSVGLVGHSWGGEGVARCVALNSVLSKNYGIKAVVFLGSSVVSQLSIPGVHTLIVLPFLDGQGRNLSGEQYAEVSRHAYNDDVLRSSILLMSENHNFFNTEWSPGAPFGWDDTGSSAYIARHRPAEVQKIGAFYMSGFFRLALGGEQQFLPLFDGSSVIIPVMPRAEATSSAYFPASSRYLVQSFETLYTNDSSSMPGNWDWVVSVGVGEIKTGHPPGYLLKYAYSVAHSYLHFGGEAPAAPAELQLYPRQGMGPVDLSPYTQLKFHVAVLLEDNPEGSVELVVRLGEASSLGESSRRLQPLPERWPGSGGLFLHQQITIPLEEFSIDLARPVDTLSFTLPNGGAIYLSDIVFVKPSLGVFRPLQLPIVSLMEDTPVYATGEEQELEVTFDLSDVSSARITMRIYFELIHRVLGRLLFEKTVTVEPGEGSGSVKYLVPAGGFRGTFADSPYYWTPIRIRAPTNVMVNRAETRFLITPYP